MPELCQLSQRIISMSVVWCISVYHILYDWGEGCFHHVHGGDMYTLRLDFTIPAKDTIHLTFLNMTKVILSPN